MLTYVFVIIGLLIVVVVMGYCMAAGFRNGDRPGDARVTGQLAAAEQDSEERPVVVATVRNPSGTPVIVGLSARKAFLPVFLAGPVDISVPRWTRRRKFSPAEYATVGVVPAGGAAEFAVPVVARGHRYLMTAALGQEGGRLRVCRLRLDGAAAPLGRRRIGARVD